MKTSTLVRVLEVLVGPHRPSKADGAAALDLEAAARLCAAGRSRGSNWFGLATGAAFRAGEHRLSCNFVNVVSDMGILDLNAAHAVLKCAAQVGSPALATHVLRGLADCRRAAREGSGEDSSFSREDLLLSALQSSGIPPGGEESWLASPPVIHPTEVLHRGNDRLTAWVESGMLPENSHSCEQFRPSRDPSRSSRIRAAERSKRDPEIEGGDQKPHFPLVVTGFESPLELALLSFANSGQESIRGLGALSECIVSCKGSLEAGHEPGFDATSGAVIARISRSLLESIWSAMLHSGGPDVPDTMLRMVQAFSGSVVPIFPSRRLVHRLMESLDGNTSGLIQLVDALRAAVSNYDAKHGTEYAKDLRRCPINAEAQLPQYFQALGKSLGPDTAWLHALELRSDHVAMRPEASSLRILAGMLIAEVQQVAHSIVQPPEEAMDEFSSETKGAVEDLPQQEWARPPLLGAAAFCASSGPESEAVLHLLEELDSAEEQGKEF